MEQGGSVLEQYSIAYKDLELSETLGEGSFGTVLKGTLRGATAVAIKTMRVEKVTRMVVSDFRAEIIASWVDCLLALGGN